MNLMEGLLFPSSGMHHSPWPSPWIFLASDSARRNPSVVCVHCGGRAIKPFLPNTAKKIKCVHLGAMQEWVLSTCIHLAFIPNFCMVSGSFFRIWKPRPCNICEPNHFLLDNKGRFTHVPVQAIALHVCMSHYDSKPQWNSTCARALLLMWFTYSSHHILCLLPL